jgi:hypothetical protein
MEDFELIAQELSAIGERVGRLENLISDVLTRLGGVEKVNGQLEGAALKTARALQEISTHWDSVYEAMRRNEESEGTAMHRGPSPERG